MEKVLAMLKGGGHNKCWGSRPIYAVAGSFSHIVEGARKSFHSLKERARKVLRCLEGGGAQKVSDPIFSHFVAPPLPVINDQFSIFLN